jgi:hypothetical protein
MEWIHPIDDNFRMVIDYDREYGWAWTTESIADNGRISTHRHGTAPNESIAIRRAVRAAQRRGRQKTYHSLYIYLKECITCM